MGYFQKITQDNLCEIIEATERELYLCLPSIHEEIKNSILKLWEQKKYVKIYLLIDFDPQTLRQGYGEFNSISKLFGKINIKELPDNRISFIISENIGFFLFIESRSIVPANKQTLNAINIDPITKVRIKHHFFSTDINLDFKDEIANAIIDESSIIEKAKDELLKENSTSPNLITQERYDYVKKDIEVNPPLKPDFKRIVEYYSNKYQYAELNYQGQNIQHATISIPPKILPYKNEEIKNKMITKFKLFENIDESDFFKRFKEIEIHKKRISEIYLTPIRCRPNKSVLKKADKIKFLEEIENLKNDLEKSKKNLYGAMVEEIKKSKKFLKESLYSFLLDNPTDDMKKMGIKNYQVIAENISGTLVDKLSMPDPLRIIDKFSFKLIFSDLTFEDLSDKELIKELSEKNILDQNEKEPLSVFGKGIELEQIEGL